MEVLASLAGIAGNYLCGFLSSPLAVLLNFQENENVLTREKEDLLSLKKSILEELEKADAEGKTPTIRVTEWVKGVERMETKLNAVESDVSRNKEHLHGCCMNCRLRYRLSNEMAQMAEQIKQLATTGDSLQGSATENPRPNVVEHVPGPSIMGQKSVAEMLRRMLDLLKDDNISRIGIWGMGGVGKTTLLKNLNNNLACLPSDPAFSIVIWITVSKELDLNKIQSQILDRLNMELRATETMERRAIRLFQRLKKEKKILLFLDDVWEEIDLDRVGIPHGEADVSCKIMVTTRSLEVCRVMKTDRDLKVDVLSNEEGWGLFRQNAGDAVGMKGIRPLARSIARKCGGLPLAIITVARAMRGKMRIELWEDALMELQRSTPYIRGIESEVFLPLKWSYDSLQGNNIKPCFLFCSLFPEDFSIKVNDLVQYWRAEGLIDEHHNQEESYNKGIALIENMKDSCMLEAGEQEETVKMHDVVRDVSIWIGSSLELEGKNFVRSGMGLTEVPNEWLGASYRRISLMCNKITELPDNLMRWSDVYTLLLQDNPLKEIPGGFFHGCPTLRVLNLSGTQITYLPHSLTELRELRALILRNCISLEELPPLENLRKLRFLDLYGAHITELPRGMEELGDLRKLNLARTHHLQNIQANIISMLSNLEELDMAFSAYKWDVIDDSEQDRASVEELMALRNLHSIYIRIESLKFLSCDLSWIHGLKRYNIAVGPRSYESNYLRTEHDERRVLLGSITIPDIFQRLLSNATALVLDTCVLSSEFAAVPTVNRLKSLTIVGCNRLESVARGDVNRSILPDLEELYLHRLHRLVSLLSITSGKILHRRSFRSLRTMHVTDCSSLVHLITVDLLCHLVNLEEIKIRNCRTLEEVILGSEKYGDALPRLRNLELHNHGRLRCVSREPLKWPSLQQLVVQKCPCLQKLPLEAHHMRTVKLRGDAPWNYLLPGGAMKGWDIMKLATDEKGTMD